MARPFVILEPGTTDAVGSNTFTADRKHPKLVALYPEANLGTDTAALQVQAPDDSWVNVTDDNGDVVLSDTNNRMTEVVVGPGTYRIYAATRTLSWGAWVEDY